MVDLFSRMGDVFWVAGCLPLALIILYIRGCLHQGAKLNSAKEDICCSFYFSSKLFFLLDPPYPASSHANFPPPQRGDWTMISFALPTLNKYIYIYINKFNLFYTYLSYSLFYTYSITISKILVSKSSFFLMLHFYLITLIRISNTSPTYSKLNMFHSYLCGFFPTRRRDGVRTRHPLSDPSHPIVILLWTYWLECCLQIEVYTKLNMLTPAKSQREPSSFCLECLKCWLWASKEYFEDTKK